MKQIPFPSKLFTYLLPLLLSVTAVNSHAQLQAINTPGEILLAMQKLKVTGSVLYIAAHPDDENTRLLAYLANDRKLETGYLSLTRGDGGQNLIGKEQGEALGLLRTQELLAARRIDGAQQFFTRANDFGYSKNPEETFNIWNHEQILGDVVYAIRKFRPDVIITRFPTTGEGGHGHHTASAILAGEAFDAAADPKRFPEQLKIVAPWQAKSLFWNTYRFGSTNTTAEDQLKIDVGGYNTLLGKSYGEIAAESRSSHKSQGFGSSRTRGEVLEYFKLIKGTAVSKDIFEHINKSWGRFENGGTLEAEISAIIQNFDPTQPSKSVGGLLAVYKKIEALRVNDATLAFYKKAKLKEVKDLIVACAGIWIEAVSDKVSSTENEAIPITSQFINRGDLPASIRVFNYPKLTDSTLDLKPNKLTEYKHSISTGKATNPYWLQDVHPVANYIIIDEEMLGKPENDNGPSVKYELKIGGEDLIIERPVIYKSTDPVKGEVYRPFEVLPAVTVEIADKVLVFNSDNSRTVQITVKANRDNVDGLLKVSVPAGWKVTGNDVAVNIPKAGEVANFQIQINSSPNAKNGSMEASVNIAGKTFGKSIHRIEYDHVPYQFFLQDATAKLVRVDLKKRGNKIGYIAGAGDEVPASLMQIGYEVTQLTDAMLASDDLGKYDAIVSGIRAYNVNDKLPSYHPQLMKFVENGGNYIVQYNTNSRVGPVVSDKMGPWPFIITRERVTDEKAEIKFIDPKAAVLNSPNKISEADFKDWVQERGIYFAGDIDPKYQKVFTMHDLKEDDQDGSLIIGKYGKGNFIYTGIVFFRELPAGVPGAYRLFANLLSLE